VAAVVGLVLVACHDPSAVSVRQELDTVFWKLTAEPRGVTVAMGKTQQISAIPRFVTGESMPNPPRATFRSADSNMVSVDSTGLLLGKIPSQGTRIYVTMQVNGLTHTDTVTVNVSPVEHPIPEFSIQVPSYDSAKVAVGDTKVIFVYGEHGAPMFDLATDFQSSNPLVLQVLPSGPIAVLRAIAPGTSDVIARTTSFGQSFEDTLHVTVTYPIRQTVTVDTAAKKFTTTVHVRTGGTVTWVNNGSLPVDVVFDDPPAPVTGGDIAAFVGAQSRTFATAGTYKYHSTAMQATGQVIVH
jgi:plastocyanin